MNKNKVEELNYEKVMEEVEKHLELFNGHSPSDILLILTIIAKSIEDSLEWPFIMHLIHNLSATQFVKIKKDDICH